MSNLAAAGGKLIIDNGRERRTDGFIRHLGQLDTSSLRVSGLGGHPALTGAGVETIFFSTPTPGGSIQCYDRDAQAYRDLNIAGHNVTVLTQSGGVLSLPNGSITTAMIAPNTTQQVIGQYTAGNAFACSTAPWVESTIQFNATCTGGLMVRLEASVSFYNSVVTSLNYLGFGIDGAAQVSFAITHCPVAGYVQSASGVFYMVPTAGVHRFSVMVGVNTGTMTFYNGANALFYATEQRR